MFCFTEYIRLSRDGASLIRRSSVKPFDDLLYYPTTLGMEVATDSNRSPLDPEGLCVSLS